jgi:hypothetical protein
MKFIEIFKNLELWKIIFMGTIILFLAFGGYTIRTKWVSISREDREMTKVKSQTNYAIDMKNAMVVELCNLYEIVLKEYIEEKGLQVSYSKIKADVKYYKLIAIAMSDACEDITIDRYIHNNDLYRYKNHNDWVTFKQNVVNIYMRKGTEVIENLYDNSKVILPLNEWHQRGGLRIYNTLSKNTNEMLEYLKIESCIFYLQHNGD